MPTHSVKQAGRGSTLFLRCGLMSLRRSPTGSGLSVSSVLFQLQPPLLSETLRKVWVSPEPRTWWSGRSSGQHLNFPLRETWHFIPRALKLLNFRASPSGTQGPSSAVNKGIGWAEGNPRPECALRQVGVLLPFPPITSLRNLCLFQCLACDGNMKYFSITRGKEQCKYDK